MGNKDKILDFIIPEIEALTKPGETICDLMAGTHSIGYALKRRNRVVANDIQNYSAVIGSTLLGNFDPPVRDHIYRMIIEKYLENMSNMTYSFFYDNYSDTYFSKKQCIEIDSLRYSIDFIDDPLKDYLLTLLMSAMTKVQSSPGHFAQFMPKDHSRIIPLRKMSVIENMLDRASSFENFVVSKYSNLVRSMDYRNLLQEPIIKDVSLFYVDSPYNTEQYSRFYHILETLVKYDNPNLNHKAKYREDRVKSMFSSKRSVSEEFDYLTRVISNLKRPLLVSYSTKGLLTVDELNEIFLKYYESCRIKYMDYSHSSQGKGSIKVVEVLFVLTEPK